MKETTAESADAFPPTRWSLVTRRGEGQAMEELCSVYWRPVYGFLRRTGHDAHDAEDLTQSFFAQLLKDDSLARAQKERGKLRSFLLGSLKRHLSAERRFANREKRGGGEASLPLATSEHDFAEAEHNFAAQPGHELSPDKLFEQRWAFELLARAHQRLEHDYQAASKGQEYELLKNAVTSTGDIDASHAAKRLGVKEASIRVLVHRLRRNFRAAFKDEITETVNSPEEAEEEFQHLLSAFSV